MTPTLRFIRRLQKLHEGDLSLLRRSHGRPLDHSGLAFDLFTGIWWPLREKTQRAPQRWCAWLVAKLYGSFPLPEGARPVAVAVGALEPRRPADKERYRGRFDALLASPGQDLALEPHLRTWLQQIEDRSPSYTAINWSQLLDDLWRWDRPLNPADTWDVHRLGDHYGRRLCRESHQTIQEVWACDFLNPTFGGLQ